jgi:hypothetical protein
MKPNGRQGGMESRGYRGEIDDGSGRRAALVGLELDVDAVGAGFDLVL